MSDIYGEENKSRKFTLYIGNISMYGYAASCDT